MGSFDHLDDPDAPGPRPDVRAAVGERARVLLLRRRLLVGGTSAAALSVVLVLALALASSGATGGHSSLDYVSDPPVATSAHGETPTAAPSATPTPTASETPVATATHGATPSPEPMDGVVAYGGCEVTREAPTGPATQDLVAGLTATVVIPRAVAAGEVVTADLTLHNDTDKTFFLEVYEQNSNLVQIRGAAHSWTDAIVSDDLEVPPHGDVVRHPTGAAVTDCGSSSSPGPPLPAGTYDAGVALSISQIESTDPAATPTPAGAGVLGLPSSTPSAGPTPEPTPTRTRESLLVQRSFGSTITVR
jgi:hypothetical protein